MKRFLLALLLVSNCAWGAEQVNLPKVQDLVMLSGSDYILYLMLKDSTGTAINITGFQYAAQFRAAPYPAGTLFATYSTVTVTPQSGLLSVRLSKSQTRALSGKTGVWDLKQTDLAGLVSYIMTGKVAVTPTVTP